MEPTSKPSESPVISTLAPSGTTESPTNEPTLEPTSSPTASPTEEDGILKELGLDDLDLEVLIAIGVVGVIILCSSVMVIVCVCRKKDIWSMDDSDDGYEVTALSGPKEHSVLDVRHTPFTVTEEDHIEMLRLARENSESVGLEKD